MAEADRTDPMLSAAVLKWSMTQKGLADTPGFRVVYSGVLRDLGVTDDAVERYIAQHRERVAARAAAPKKE